MKKDNQMNCQGVEKPFEDVVTPKRTNETANWEAVDNTSTTLSSDTNQKFVGRIENMLYYVCGCDLERGKLILELCLESNLERRRLNEKRI
jgi:hypothetical protein